MNLRSDGFRFLGHREGQQGKWVHPAEVAAHVASEWVDLTNATDDEMTAFYQ